MPVLTRKPGALRNGAPFRNWALPEPVQRVRERLSGYDDGDRQMVKILCAAMHHGLDAVTCGGVALKRRATGCRMGGSLPMIRCGVASTLSEALSMGTGRLVSRQGHTTVETIEPPPCLRLREVPQADCERYDRLRGLPDGS